MHYTEVQQKHREKYACWHSLDEKYLDLSFQNGESKRQVRQRIFEGLMYYPQQTECRYIAISGHGILLSQTLLALGEQITNIPNGSIAHLTFENNQWCFEGML